MQEAINIKIELYALIPQEKFILSMSRFSAGIFYTRVEWGAPEFCLSPRLLVLLFLCQPKC